MKYTIDWKEYAGIAREAVAEGCVLLKNDSALPIKKDSKISIFGRIQFHYYKSGTGSGGMVNVPYVVSILDALKEEKDITINEDLLEEYKKWVDENPYNKGTGWANDPWCQEEMELTDEMVKKAAENSDEAVIIIGRTAGEDKDNSAKEGSYLLTSKEEAMLEKVCKYFDKTVVVLNVGNIIDMKWVAKYNPSAVLYAWQGGMEGGHGVADILLGRVNPCGKLADTIAYDYKDYPSTPNFNKNLTDVDASAYMELKHSGKLENNDRDIYEEDIYVGYRYFETIAKDKVLYPFGFGMSYTSFDIESECTYEDGLVKVVSKVTNTGEYAGKETVQIYYNPAQGKLSKPVRNLIEFAKTKVLMPGESQKLSFEIDVNKMESYDDGGYTGHANSFVLEAGDYEIYAGNSVRDSKLAGSFNIPDLIVVKELEEALAPNYKFDRMVLKVEGDKVTKLSQSVPQRTIDLDKRILDNRPEDKPCTGDKGYKFINVAKGEVSIEDYLAQLTDEDLIHMSRGEGMCSSKVTAGIAGSYGGVTKRLHDVYGMPVAGLSDGPSGIRMDCGTEAFAMPNGTSLACTFNKELVNKLYQYAAKEIRFNKIDSLLGPGVNIHRNPLNGRNFEYFSEDPYLTGAMAVAQLKGLHTTKVTGTIKHFAGNNREFNRHFVNSTVSQRALREIYLKAFEMAVEEAGAYNIMTTYGLVNEIYTAGNYDLNTTILRGDWGFEGLVMTDWWAKINEEGKPGTIQNVGFMIRAQNDVYEVTADSENNGNNDDAMEKLAAGVITRGELLRNATNIVKSLLKAPVTDRLLNGEDDITEINKPESSKAKPNIMPAKEFTDGELELDLTGLNTSAGSINQFPLKIEGKGRYQISVKLKSDLGELSQTSMNVSINNMLIHTETVHGTNGEWITKDIDFEIFLSIDNYLDIAFAQTGIDIERIVVTKKYAIEESEII